MPVEPRGRLVRVRHEEVFVAVVVVVAEGDAHPVVGQIHAGLARDLGEGPVAVVQEHLGQVVHREPVEVVLAAVEIQVAVPVQVHPGRPRSVEQADLGLAGCAHVGVRQGREPVAPVERTLEEVVRDEIAVAVVVVVAEHVPHRVPPVVQADGRGDVGGERAVPVVQVQRVVVLDRDGDRRVRTGPRLRDGNHERILQTVRVVQVDEAVPVDVDDRDAEVTVCGIAQAQRVGHVGERRKRRSGRGKQHEQHGENRGRARIGDD